MRIKLEDQAPPFIDLLVFVPNQNILLVEHSHIHLVALHEDLVSLMGEQ